MTCWTSTSVPATPGSRRSSRIASCRWRARSPSATAAVERTEDLIQVASLGLVKALRGYDPERGRRFAAYAAPTILGELRRHFRDHSWRLHVPRGLQELSLAVEKATSRLADDLGHSPSVREIAEFLEVPDERILDVLEAKESQRSVSLDVPRHRGEDDAAPMIEAMGNDDDSFDAVESQLAVEQCAGLDRARAGGRRHVLRRAAQPERDRRPDRRLPDAGIADPAQARWRRCSRPSRARSVPTASAPSQRS